MSVKEVGDWVTLVGASVAAVTGVWNLSLRLRGKRDHFVVRLGSASPTIDQETMLRVVSHSDHPVKLTDCGFINADGRFASIRMHWEAGALHSDEITSRGSSELGHFGAHFETGHIRREPPLGAYAISITQRRPTLAFAPEMPFHRRLWIRGRLWLQPEYLGW